ncbi:MAG: hypothetical protein CM1200mP3_18360 [Chloroflexota bacterium]|nr:MAG: hypothetical protein CM1200mP3_18360 [Chloroflexota bacterium]
MKDKLNGLDEPVYEFSIQANKKNPANAGHASNLTGHVKGGFLLPNIFSAHSNITCHGFNQAQTFPMSAPT